jgi:hypothetical protein
MDTWHTRHEEYLKTDHWKNLRIKCFKNAKKACEACRSKKDLHGHHIRYREPLESCTENDVMALCDRCHTLWHAHLKEKGLRLDGFSRETTVKWLRSLVAKLPRGEWRNNKKRKKQKGQKAVVMPTPPKYQIPPQYNDKFSILERVVFAQANEILLLKQRLAAIEAKFATIEIIQSPMPTQQNTQ